MHKGKIVLVPFPFTDLSGQKIRPALVLSVESKGDDFIACFISSKSNDKVGAFDLKVKADKQNGLKADSIIKVSKIATLEKKIAIGEIGGLDRATFLELNLKLKKVFGLE
ncbi:MAG: type II toxin-antitoxin system PemK/MazF family toxin [Patescibacteria group bacterium]